MGHGSRGQRQEKAHREYHRCGPHAGDQVKGRNKQMKKRRNGKNGQSVRTRDY